MIFKKLVVTLFCILALVIVMGGNSVTADEEEKELAINVLPGDVLFNINNMKPGDWAPRTITVQNKGIKDFTYQMSLRNDGEEKLFNELLLEINDSKTVLYEGKLADFTKLSDRDLSTSKQEELEVTVIFPEYLGNEFQGLDAEFSILFTAEGKTSQLAEVSVDGMIGSGNSQTQSFLPNTATGIFNLFLSGAVLLISGVFILLYKKWRKVSKNYS
ncbi:LPXTG cell wall anchor domain-containing protein [Virgibacillus halodenitrificans]|uniref:LPXTG cell wall anchor domain-containing protein n=1 Tax=Virgibacillus halodenitrificans TaxID=1482 RepID=UPI001EEED1BB|nr:LPXTG cell wall anchor domain-containing protein [Virgibacillus halodenitrificans]MCG1026827.1 LPXTG cell wall anchor domain-containing protein [Virgibacillus halodenitrificans]MCJ0932596.1 LPXTG cell wall anchor domain-containing protein [Virgibacillus halodenitrificans]